MNLNTILSYTEPTDTTSLWIDMSTNPISAKVMDKGKWTPIINDVEENTKIRELIKEVQEHFNGEIDRIDEALKAVDSSMQDIRDSIQDLDEKTQENIKSLKENIESQIQELRDKDTAIDERITELEQNLKDNYVTYKYGEKNYGTLEEQKSLRTDVEELFGETAELEANKLDKTEAAEIYATKQELEDKATILGNEIEAVQNDLDATKENIENNYVKNVTFEAYKEEESNVHQTIQKSIQDTKSDLETKINTKQDKLTAGDGIRITEDNVIESTLDLTIIRVVSQLPLPENAESNKIYFVKNTVEGQSDIYIEYIVVEGKWEKLGEYKTKIDLSGYLTTEKALQTFAKVDGTNASGIWDITAARASRTVGKLTFKGYQDIEYDGYVDKVVNLPTKLSQFENDVDFATKAEGAVNPYSLIFTGAVSKSYNGSETITVAIPVIPESLPNPYTLSWSGYDNGSYNGSKDAKFNIPSDTNQLTNSAGYITVNSDILGNAASADYLRRTTEEKYALNKTDGGVTYGSIPYVTNEGSIRLGNTLQLFDNTASVFKVKLKGINKDEIVLDFPSKSGTFALLSDIPTKLPNPQALKFTGALTNSYDGSTEVTIDLPTKYPNPYLLTFNGAVTGTYDGSEATEITIPSLTGGSAAESDKYVSGVTVSGHTVNVTKGALASTTVSGLMSSADKTKLDSVASNAEVNQNAFSNVKVGTTTVAANSKIDTLELKNGTGISISANTIDGSVTIGHSNNVTAGTASGGSGNVTFGGSITIPSITYDAQGHITSTGTTTVTLPANPNTNTTYTFEGGTDKFTVTPSGGKAQDVAIDVTVTNSNPTLSWSTTSTIGTVSGDALTVKMPANPNTDTKNTAGSTNKVSTKLFLIGAESQDANPQTYSNVNTYIGTDNCLYSSGKKVLTDHQSLANYALKTEVSNVQNQLNTLVENNDAQNVINSFNEIEAFLQGVTNKQTLTELLEEQKNTVITDAANKYVKKSGDTMTGTLTATGFRTSNGTSSQFLKADGSVSTLTATATKGDIAAVTFDNATGKFNFTLPKGDTGAQGPKGETGAVGPQGPAGAKGDTWVPSVNSSTGELTWTKNGSTTPTAVNIKGPKGDTGAKGDKGDTGLTGATGPAGPQGKTGATGPAGPKGDKGDTGAQGLQGPKGNTGPAGPTGAQGPTGPQGPAGKVWKPTVSGNSINWKLEDASSTTTLNSTLSIPWSSITSLPDTLVYYDPDNYSIYQYGPRDNINELRLGSIDNSEDRPNTLYFGDNDYCYIQEDSDDHLVIRTGLSGISFYISDDYTVKLPTTKDGTIALLSDIPNTSNFVKSTIPYDYNDYTITGYIGKLFNTHYFGIGAQHEVSGIGSALYMDGSTTGIRGNVIDLVADLNDGNIRANRQISITSDERLKENIITVNNDDPRLSYAASIELKNFNYKGSHLSTIGYIAQDVQKVLPNLVSEDKEGYLSLNYTELLLLKVAALEKENKELKEKVNSLEERLNKLEKIINNIIQ